MGGSGMIRGHAEVVAPGGDEGLDCIITAQETAQVPLSEAVADGEPMMPGRRKHAAPSSS
jgi:hypothetical protein